MNTKNSSIQVEPDSGGAGSTVTAPKQFLDYIDEEYGGLQGFIEHNVVFNVGLERHGDARTALQVALQTKYAGWKGGRDFAKRLETRSA